MRAQRLAVRESNPSPSPSPDPNPSPNPLALAPTVAFCVMKVHPKPKPNQAHKAKPADEQARVAYERAKVEFAAFQN